jgi:hypothetical protein
MSQNLQTLIEKLQAWKEHDFHADRQLSDEVLIADGWKCEADESFEGGIRWFWGTSPQISCSEKQRPHLIHDLNTAIGVVPPGCSLRLMIYGQPPRQATAHVSCPIRGGRVAVHEFEGSSDIPTIAVLIAALKTKQILEAKHG